MKMFTRQEYMNGTCDHRRYYAQFVTPGIYAMVYRRFTPERLVNCQDQKNFNTIPLHLWDQLEPAARAMVNRQLMRELGEIWSLGTAVCVLKEAARQVVETHWAMEAA